MSRSDDVRGNTTDRRRRRAWLLDPESGFGGDGRTVPCHWCQRPLASPEADRFPIPGRDGGRYERGNVVPACRRCNSGREKVTA